MASGPRLRVSLRFERWHSTNGIPGLFWLGLSRSIIMETVFMLGGVGYWWADEHYIAALWMSGPFWDRRTWVIIAMIS